MAFFTDDPSFSKAAFHEEPAAEIVLPEYRPGLLRKGFTHLIHQEAIAAAQTYIAQQFHRSLTLLQLARQVHISPYHFARIFKHHTGVTPHHYILKVRLAHAAHLLRSTELSVTDICYQCGFNRPDYFASAFRRHFQCSPRQYRTATAGA